MKRELFSLEHSVLVTQDMIRSKKLSFSPIIVTGKGNLLISGLSGQSSIRNQVLQSKVKIDLQFISILVYSSTFNHLKKRHPILFFTPLVYVHHFLPSVLVC